MDLGDDVKHELVVAFQAELEELLGKLNQGLLALETNPAQEEREIILTELFRAAHTIKGGARAVGIRDIEKISHRLEDVMGDFQRGKIPATPELFDLLFQTLDGVSKSMAAYLRDQELPRDQRDAIITRLEGLKRIEGIKSPAHSTDPIQPGPAKREEERGPDSPSPPAAGKEPTSPAKKSSPRSLSTDETIRVTTAKVDSLLDRMGELLVARMRTEQRLGEFHSQVQSLNNWQKSWRKVRGHYTLLRKRAGHGPEIAYLLEFLTSNEKQLQTLNTEMNNLQRRFDSDYRHLALLTDDMHEGIRRVRMVPVTTLFELFPRMVRDLAREQDKEVSLVIEGAETEVDRQLLDTMKDPLTHLLRNAVDHGIETPDQRQKAGKPRRGTIYLKAVQKGNIIALEVKDDGAGIDLKTVKQAALERGLLTPTEIDRFGPRELQHLIYTSGFSTRPEVTELSGRGVGLDVVRKNLEHLQGVIEVESELGQGTTFNMTLPLTLATSHVLLLGVAGEIVAVPTTTVVRILKVNADGNGSIQGKSAIRIDALPLSLISLAQILEFPRAETSVDHGGKKPVVVMGIAEGRLAFQVDELFDTQEVVIKSLGRMVSRVRNVAGATILGDGRVVMILNVADLMKSAQRAGGMTRPCAPKLKEVIRRRLLVVDDSITTRTMEKNILENAGYQVLTAADGEEAWALLQDESLDGVVADVKMPHMDGFTLTQKVKNDQRFQNVPVVLVTSLESPEDKIRGMESGADAYITKGTFDQMDLLGTIERLLG
ncbi:MAG: hybrid sensor histidine kinase/response regulator [Pseudomonadota bacterium]